MKSFQPLATLVVVAFTLFSMVPSAVADDAAAPAATSVDDEVAAWLFDRAMQLFGQNQIHDAKKLFIESLERSPEGPKSADALAMLRSSNERLGIDNLEEGRPNPAQQPVDPYADPIATDNVLDPYAPPSADTPLDPYAAGTGGEIAPPTERDASTGGRTALIAWSGGWGAVAGLAIAGPTDESDGVTAGAILLAIATGAAAGGGSYALLRKRSVTSGEAAAIASGGNWGMYNLGLLGDVVTGTESETNDVFKYVAAGGLIGAGAGIWYASRYSPSEGDVSFTNSLGLYGTSLGLLLGVAIDPPHGEAYSLNGFFGSAGGLALGFLLDDRVDTSRSRMLRVDLGAAAGAATPWVLLYPLISDSEESGDEQVVGLLSMLTLVGGAGVSWHLTRKMDAKPSLSGGSEAAPAMSLLRRSSRGRWDLGTPLLRPMPTSTALAPDPGGFSLGVDVLSGRF